MKVRQAISRTGLKIKKYSPEILMGAGVIGFVGTVILACHETTKAGEILDAHRDKMNDISQAIAITDAEEYSEKDIQKDKMIVYAHTAVDFAKLYAPAIALGVLSITSILVSNKIIKKRYLGAVAAYNVVSTAFAEYRNRVKSELGDEMDHHFRYGTENGTEIVEVVDENGKKKKVKQATKEIDKNNISGYARVFDNSCPDWDENPNFSLFFLRAQESYANDRLSIRGHLFLNEVYEMLGFPATPEGAVAGWLKNGDGDSYVDFGLHNYENPSVLNFINGKSNEVLLDFNVDGVIFDKI